MANETKTGKTKLFVGLGIGLLVILVILGVGSFMSEHSTSRDSQGYSAQDKTDMINSCVQGSQGRNTQEVINTYCNCNYDYLHSHITYDELNKLNSGSGDFTMDTAPQVLKDAIKACSK